MNILILCAGVMGLFTTMGHILAGRKLFLLPLLESDCPDVPKKVFHGLFHLITVNFSFFTLILWIEGLGLSSGGAWLPVVLFAGISFLAYGVVEILIALTSGIPGALGKMFVWIFFLLTGGLSLAGYLMA